jgi:serine protease Do
MRVGHQETVIMRLFRSAPARAALLGASFLMITPYAAGVLIPPAAARSAPDSFADLAEKLLPAVVNVSSTQTAPNRTAQNGLPEMPQFPPGSPFEQFFRDFFNRNRPGGRDAQPRPMPRAQSLGSGFIVDASGLVVTNNHVIEGADEISITLQDNTTLKAEIVGRDESTDLALLRVKPEKPLPFVSFGDSDTARVGDWVLAIGNPFGLGGSVTAGIVSARGRNIHQGPYDDFIQTDAAINRGNSGGPLFNLDGTVIGINTAIYSPSGGSIGIGFAIPAKLAANVINQLREFGQARRGWLGVRIQQVTPEIADSLGLKEATGAMVAGVNDGGPADKAKIRNGDIILKFNGQDVKSMSALPRVVADTEVGKQVPVVLWRDGKEVTIQATLGEKPSEAQLAAVESGKGGPGGEARATELSGLGMKIAPITQDAKDRFQLNTDQKGVVITDVTDGGAAADKGLKPGDIIMEVQQAEVASPADVQRRVEAARKQDRKFVLMLIQRQDGVQYIPLPLSGKEKGKPG